MTEKVSAIMLANACKNWLEAFIDVECYLPPDDYDRWPVDHGDLIADLNFYEEKLREVLEEVNKHGVEIDL